jgi:glutaredoxin
MKKDEDTRMSAQSSEPPGTVMPPRVLLVSAPDCHFCAQAKAVLDRLRREYPLEVQEVSLASPEGQDLAARHSILFPPGLFLDGTFVGFGRVSERKLRRLLEQRAHAATTHPTS